MTFENREKLIQKEYFEDGVNYGRTEGRKEGRIDTIITFLVNGGSEDDAIRLLNASDEELDMARKTSET